MDKQRIPRHTRGIAPDRKPFAMRLFLTTAAIALAAAPLFAQSESLTGDYAIHGLNPDGSTYLGSLTLTGQGTTVTAAWRVAGKGYSGTGTLDGRILTIDYGDPTPVQYIVMPDGKLHGTWSDGLALERATPE